MQPQRKMRKKSSRIPSPRTQAPRPPSPATPSSLPRPVLYALQVAVVLVIPSIALFAGDELRAAIDFASGVLTLVSLSGVVIWGLVAADRVLLDIPQRLLSQAIHRFLAVGSLGFLLLHITIKVSEARATWLATLVPFGEGFAGRDGLIGLGSLAAHCMVIAGATGAARSAFAPSGPAAARWRALHSLAYPAWFAALLHGLNAGRPAAVWVTTMYCLALVAVGAAVSVRLLPQPQRRRIARMLMSITRDEMPGTARDTAPPVRDPSVSPLPGSTRVPGGRADARPQDSRLQEPPLRIDSTRPTPVSSGRGAGISAAYRAVSSAPQPSEPFGVPPQRPAPPYETQTEMIPPVPSYESQAGTLPPVPSYEAQTEMMPSVPPYESQAGTLPPVPSYEAQTEMMPPVPPYEAQSGTLPPVPPYEAQTEMMQPVPPAPPYTPYAPTETIPTTSSYAPEPPIQTTGRWPTPSPPPPGETIRRRAEPDPAAGQSYSPPPGEPWHYPAGERP
ncbi:hypothetical protein [Streptomyces sp. 8N706]|uniref:hypothetical protein n=1 Tax=Streptomyces sp. 8N706 TaxID=3457416 RepID=UPI003FD2B1AD